MNKAAEATDPIERIKYVAAFLVIYFLKIAYSSQECMQIL